MDPAFVWQHMFFSGLNNMRYLVVYFAVYSLVVFWAIFDKAYEPGWGAIVPIYNNYLYFKITWGNGWLFLLLLIPFVNIVIMIITRIKLAKAFGKSGWFAAGLIFLGIIFLSILAFGEPRYQGMPERE